MKKKVMFFIVILMLVTGPKVQKVTASGLNNTSDDGMITISEKIYYDDALGQEITETITFKALIPSTFKMDGKVYYADPEGNFYECNE